MQPIRHDGRHVTAPASCVLINHHPVENIGTIFYNGSYLIAIDGRYYKAKSDRPNIVKTMRILMNGDLRQGVFDLQRNKLVKPFRVSLKECLRGKAPAHVTGLPPDAFVTWFHTRVDLCTFDQIDEADGEQRSFIAYQGQVYHLLPGDNVHYTDEWLTTETKVKLDRLIKGRAAILAPGLAEIIAALA